MGNKHSFFIPVEQGYHVRDMNNGTEHRIIGVYVMNAAGEPDTITTMQPVVIWGGDMHSADIFQDEPLF